MRDDNDSHYKYALDVICVSGVETHMSACRAFEPFDTRAR